MEQVLVVGLGELFQAGGEGIEGAAEEGRHGDRLAAQEFLQQVEPVRPLPVQRHRGPGDAAAADAGEQVDLVQQAEFLQLAHHAEMERRGAKTAARERQTDAFWRAAYLNRHIHPLQSGASCTHDGKLPGKARRRALRRPYVAILG
ncbi:hypothetical protein D3C76_1273630 [compost metagenome]